MSRPFGILHNCRNVITIEPWPTSGSSGDEAKNLANHRKHGIRFEDATQVFKDPFYLLVEDREIDGEQRWHAFGMTVDAVVLAVVHTIGEAREDGTWLEVIRIISARQASRKERRTYEEQHG